MYILTPIYFYQKFDYTNFVCNTHSAGTAACHLCFRETSEIAAFLTSSATHGINNEPIFSWLFAAFYYSIAIYN